MITRQSPENGIISAISQNALIITIANFEVPDLLLEIPDINVDIPLRQPPHLHATIRPARVQSALVQAHLKQVV